MPFLIFVVTFLGMILILLACYRDYEPLFYVGIVVTFVAFILALGSTVIGFGKDVDSISIETKDSIEKITVSYVDKDEANDNIIKIINSDDSISYYQIDNIETFYKKNKKLLTTY
jgi:predicted small secreted protein